MNQIFNKTSLNSLTLVYVIAMTIYHTGKRSLVTGISIIMYLYQWSVSETRHKTMDKTTIFFGVCYLHTYYTFKLIFIGIDQRQRNTRTLRIRLDIHVTAVI